MLIRRLVAVLAAGLAVCLAATTLTAAPATALEPTPLRVLIVGDSVSQGSAGDWTWRYRLFREFQAQGLPVDFVGPRVDLFDDVTERLGSRAYVDPDFDRDHASRWGAAYGAEEGRIDDLVRDHQPDVVVVMLGINNLMWSDVLPSELRDRARSFVDLARSVDPDLDVVLGKVVQTWMRPSVARFNELLDKLSAATPGTSTADGDAGFRRRAHTWDRAHPSAAGEIRIAAAVTDALAELGHMAPAPRPLPVVKQGPRLKPTLTVSRVGSEARLTWKLPPGATSGRVWQRIGTTAWSRLGGDHTSTTLSAPIPLGRRVRFKVQPVKGWLAAAPDAHSDVVTIDTTALVAQAPRSVTARAQGRRVMVRWQPGRRATRYRILLRAGSREWRTAGWSDGRSWTSKRLGSGRYAVKVRSYRGRHAGRVSDVRRVRI